MKLPTNELLLALRSPSSGWLATMVCALEEAVRDPEFTAHHRALIKQLLEAEAIPSSVSAAAEERLCRFEQRTHCLADDFRVAQGAELREGGGQRRRP